MNDPELAAVVDQWRSFAASRPPALEPTLDEAVAALRAAKVRTSRRLAPPVDGLPPGLHSLTKGWRPQWTQAIREPSAWKLAKPRLDAARAALANGDLSLAERKLHALLLESAESPTLQRDGDREAIDHERYPDDAQQADAMAALLDWLDGLR